MIEDLNKFDRYLGDGVHASYDGYQIWLAVNHRDNKVVALEPEVFHSLTTYVKWLSEEIVDSQGE
jgi:hypothetical protein